MKVNGKTGSGKTTFVSGFLEFLIADIDIIENIYYHQHLIKLAGIE